MTMRVLIVGATGMMGHILFDAARRQPGLEVYAAVRRPDERARSFLQIDAGRMFACDLLKDIDPALYCAPDVVVNCAGVVRHLHFKYSMADLITINALAPHLLAEYCDRRGARLIQLSTDCVFSGRRGNYSENDLPDPPDLHGRIKVWGEVLHEPHLTLRTSFVGHERFRQAGYFLLDWFLAQHGEVRGFTNARWSGLTTLECARVIAELIQRPQVTGLLHLHGEAMSKYELLRLAQSVYSKTDVVICPDEDFHCDRSLRSLRLNELGIRAPGIRQMLVDLRNYYLWRDGR
jgi:dTDP-4-dehydrorhamnose reductase